MQPVAAASTSIQDPPEEAIPALSEKANEMIRLPWKVMGKALSTWIKLLGEPMHHSVKALENRYGKDGFPLNLHSLKWPSMELDILEVKGYQDFILEMKLEPPAKPFNMPVQWGMSPKQIKKVLGLPQSEFDDTLVNFYLKRHKKDSEIVWEYGSVSGTYAEGLLIIFDDQKVASLVWQYGIDD
jgi:hypothetical protein